MKYVLQDPADRECDIVDDKRKRQIEFVSLFDEKVPPRVRYRSELSEEQALLMEYCDFGYNIVAAGVINKFTLKNYTDKYSKELAIYMLGPNGEAADKIEALIEMLSDYLLLAEADRRMATNNEAENISHEDMMRSLGITREELDAVDVEIEE